jgi:CRP-like cAMP-binding protein
MKKKLTKDHDALGRPSKFDIIESPKVAREMMAAGKSYMDLAEALGIDRGTVTRWIDEHPTFAAAIAQGKSDAIDRVERALMKRAEGYEHKESHYPPDVHAIKFFLSNKRSQDWREKTAVEHSGHLTLADLLTDPKTVTPPTKENEK